MRCLISIGVVVLLAGCDGSDKPSQRVNTPYVKAHDIKQLMATVMEPQADIFWGAAGSRYDATGLHDLRPNSDAEWLTTRSAAATVAEIGNLLMTPPFAEGRGDDWIQFSRSLVEVGKIAEKAAVDRDEGAIMDVGMTMYNVCSACHEVYPPAETASTATPPSPAPP